MSYKIFMAAGLIAGIIIEILALIDNAGNPLEVQQLQLFSPDPITDMIIAVAYWGVILTAWFLIIRFTEIKLPLVFIFAGVFGLFMEQGATVLFSGNLLAILLVFVVHAIPPTAAYSAMSRWGD